MSLLCFPPLFPPKIPPGGITADSPGRRTLITREYSKCKGRAVSPSSGSATGATYGRTGHTHSRTTRAHSRNDAHRFCRAHVDALPGWTRPNSPSLDRSAGARPFIVLSCPASRISRGDERRNTVASSTIRLPQGSSSGRGMLGRVAPGGDLGPRDGSKPVTFTVCAFDLAVGAARLAPAA